MNYFKTLSFLFVFVILSCNKNETSKKTASKYYIYSRASGNNLDYFIRMGKDSFCYDFTNSKIYSDFSHKVINSFRQEIIDNNDSFVISSNELEAFEIDSIVYYNYTCNEIMNYIYSDKHISQIIYHCDTVHIDTSVYTKNEEKMEKFKLIVKLFINRLDENPLLIDLKDAYKKPITDIMFYKEKGGKWKCVTIPYNSSYFNFFKTFLPK